jgi:GT2 family glycosyltransferase
MVFIHDDIEMLDFFWTYHVVDALTKYDMVGLAGNSQRTHRQAAWGSVGGDIRTGNRDYFSGTVAMKNTNKSDVSRGCIGKGGVRIFCFGPCDKKVVFIDGLFMAAHSDVFHKHKIRFDEQFAFHFYDMDLCRQFEKKNLTVGTVGISVLHDDNNSYDDPSWEKTYAKYMKKWKF